MGLPQEEYHNCRKDVAQGRVLLITDKVDLRDLCSSPLARVPRLLPNRDVAEDGRFVHDLSATPVNAGSPKDRHPVPRCPTHRAFAYDDRSRRGGHGTCGCIGGANHPMQ